MSHAASGNEEEATDVAPGVRAAGLSVACSGGDDEHEEEPQPVARGTGRDKQDMLRRHAAAEPRPKTSPLRNARGEMSPQPRRRAETVVKADTATPAGPISGFLCPACPSLVNFESETLLLKHWEACHEQIPTTTVTTQDTTTETTWREHLFTETCRAGKTCRFCGSRIWRDGLQCKSCRYACHMKCVTKARPASNCPGFYQSTNPIVKSIRKVVTGTKVRYVTEYVDLDLTYITPHIIAMSFPASGLAATYRNNLKDVAAMLRARHGDKYLVFNVSDKEYDISKLDNQVLDFGWPDHMAPPLERLCSIINSMGSWLDSDPEHVVVVHCKGGKGRTGVVVAAYFSYKRLFPNPEDAMMHFALKRFSNAEEKGDVGVTNPSQRRYVMYFQRIVTGELQVWPRPLRLLHVVMQTIPHFDKGKGCRPILAVYENLTEEVYRTPEPLERYDRRDRFMSMHINGDDGVVVRGDVTIKLWHRSRHGNDHLVLRCQIHTAAVDGDVVTLERPELDEAYRDKRVEETANLTLVFKPLNETPSEEDLKNSASAALYERAQAMYRSADAGSADDDADDDNADAAVRAADDGSGDGGGGSGGAGRLAVNSTGQQQQQQQQQQQRASQEGEEGARPQQPEQAGIAAASGTTGKAQAVPRLLSHSLPATPFRGSRAPHGDRGREAATTATSTSSAAGTASTSTSRNSSGSRGSSPHMRHRHHHHHHHHHRTARDPFLLRATGPGVGSSSSMTASPTRGSASVLLQQKEALMLKRTRNARSLSFDPSNPFSESFQQHVRDTRGRESERRDDSQDAGPGFMGVHVGSGGSSGSSRDADTEQATEKAPHQWERQQEAGAAQTQAKQAESGFHMAATEPAPQTTHSTPANGSNNSNKNSSGHGEEIFVGTGTSTADVGRTDEGAVSTPPLLPSVTGTQMPPSPLSSLGPMHPRSLSGSKPGSVVTSLSASPHALRTARSGGGGARRSVEKAKEGGGQKGEGGEEAEEGASGNDEGGRGERGEDGADGGGNAHCVDSLGGVDAVRMRSTAGGSGLRGRLHRRSKSESGTEEAGERTPEHSTVELAEDAPRCADAGMPRSHEQASWYFGRMSTDAAERLLMEKARPTTFVVRQSGGGGDPHVFRLSVRGVDEVYHFPIAWRRGLHAFEVGENEAQFSSLQELVRHYQKHPVCHVGGYPLLLGEACGARGLVAAAAHAAASSTGHSHSQRGAQQRRQRLIPLKRRPRS